MRASISVYSKAKAALSCHLLSTWPVSLLSVLLSQNQRWHLSSLVGTHSLKCDFSFYFMCTNLSHVYFCLGYLPSLKGAFLWELRQEDWVLVLVAIWLLDKFLPWWTSVFSSRGCTRLGDLFLPAVTVYDSVVSLLDVMDNILYATAGGYVFVEGTKNAP